MIARIVTWAVEKRWLVLLLTVIVAAIGAFSLYRLPIDAVPDITNNQVQINVRAPALSPELVEKQVSFPIETALAGTPGLEYTRSLSRNGFAQITAVFSDATDIYFARQQVGERLRGVQENLPDGVNPEMGPIATGLGEVYMYTVRLDHREAHEQRARDGVGGFGLARDRVHRGGDGPALPERRGDCADRDRESGAEDAGEMDPVHAGDSCLDGGRAPFSLIALPIKTMASAPKM